MMSRLFALALLSVLTACASSIPVQPPAPVQRSEPVTATRPVTPPDIDVLPAPSEPVEETVSRPETVPEFVPPPATPTSTLLASVDEAIASGDLDRAAALTDRALRISPRDPLLWYRRASISHQQQRYNEATGFARRALSFSGSDPALTRDINLLLEQISR